MTAAAGSNFDVLVSYAQEDRDWARELAMKLDAEGLPVSLDEWTISPGGRITSRLKSLRTTYSVVLVIGPAWSVRGVTPREVFTMLTPALEAGPHVIPVLYGAAETIPLLATRQWIDFRNATGSVYDHLVQELVAVLHSKRPGLPSSQSLSSEADHLWSRLSSSCQTALGWAIALRRTGQREAATAALLLGIIRTHGDNSEPEVLLRHFGYTTADLIAAIRIRHPEDPLNAERPEYLRAMPVLSTNAREALRVAAEGAETATASLSHLFGGLLSRPESGAYTTLQSVIAEVAVADVARSYSDYLNRGKDASYAEFLQERFPRAAAPGGPDDLFRRERAGYASDAIATEDWLGFQAEIVPLCEVIMA